MSDNRTNNKYTPTTDEVDTGFTTFAWELEKEEPGTYGHGFENYHEVCASFRRWLAEVERKAAEKALTDAADECATGYESTDNSAVASWLRKRAAAYRREDTE